MDKKEWQREYNRRRHEEALPAYNALMSCYPLSLENLEGEEWKPIAGFDKYQVSNFGRVKSFWKKPPCILKPKLPIEYLSVDLYIDGKQKRRSIHILVARAFIPNPENKPEVNHDDGHKFNCHVSNLVWSTSAENSQHAVRAGLIKSGEDSYQAKLTAEQIIYIRENPDKLTQEQLAAMFGVTDGIISAIQLGKTYENAGGTIREKSKHPYNYISDEIREQIRADWATGQYTKSALARKFGYGRTTISRIINEPAA